MTERDAWLSEMWPVCREVPREERAAKRQADWEQRVALADRKVSTDTPQMHTAA